MVCQEEIIISKVLELYNQISSLESLTPSKNVDMLFTELVHTCTPPIPLDVTKFCPKIQGMRSNLIKLCGEAEGLMETHFSTILTSFDDNPLDHLSIFPYLSNYIKLSQLEYTILTQHFPRVPEKVAFIGSGPLPLTSIVLAKNHLPSTIFHNYDISVEANSLASSLVSSDADLSERMFFHTSDIMDVTTELKDYQVVFLAALVGMDRESKVKVIEHLAKYMAPRATLMVRSAHGARAFLYPVVEQSDLRGFEVLSTFHPIDEVINSVVIARKKCIYTPSFGANRDQGLVVGAFKMPCKCAERLDSFCPFYNELTLDEHRSA